MGVVVLETPEMTSPNQTGPNQTSPNQAGPNQTNPMPPGSALTPTDSAAPAQSQSSDGRSTPAAGQGNGTGPALAGTVVDRRMFADRRNVRVNGKQVKLTGDDSGFERRRGPGRRLSDFTRSAEEGDLTQEQFLFLMAVEQFKKSNGKTFPTWTDVLEIVRLLGYRKTMPMECKLTAGEDWQELANTPSNVRPQRWAERAAIDRSRRAA